MGPSSHHSVSLPLVNLYTILKVHLKRRVLREQQNLVWDSFIPGSQDWASSSKQRETRTFLSRGRRINDTILSPSPCHTSCLFIFQQPCKVPGTSPIRTGESEAQRKSRWRSKFVMELGRLLPRPEPVQLLPSRTFTVGRALR